MVSGKIDGLDTCSASTVQGETLQTKEEEEDDKEDGDDTDNEDDSHGSDDDAAVVRAAASRSGTHGDQDRQGRQGRGREPGSRSS